MPEPDHTTIQVNRYASVAAAALIGPLTALLVYLDNHPQFSAAWFYLIGICILVFSLVTVRAFPFTPSRPQRMLLRFYLALCLLLELTAFNFHEPRIPVLDDAILLGSIAMVLYCVWLSARHGNVSAGPR